MTFLPIVERELRVASRRRGTYWRRFGAAALALLVGMWILVADRNEDPNQMGHSLFLGLSIMVFIGVTFVGAQCTADCLSEEKREGTLGLLFLTDLKGYDVVFGKLAATSLELFYDLMAIVPTLAVPMLLGGVGKGEFARVVVVELNLLMLSVSVGMFCSAASKSSVQSWIRAICILILLLAAIPVFVFLAEITNNSAAFGSLMLLCPASDCYAAFEDNYIAEPAKFWINAAITQGFSWIFLALACKIVPSCWQDAVVGQKPVKAESERSSGGRERARELDENPYLWRAYRGNQSGVGWAALGVIGVCWLWGQHLRSGELDSPLSWLAVISAHLLLKLWLCIEACRAFSEDRRGGAMELLLSTPISEREIISGQRAALMKIFWVPVAAMVTIDLGFLSTMSGISELEAQTSVTMTGFLVADLYALSWVAPWLALKARSTNAAVRSAFWRIVIIPTLIPIALAMVLTQGPDSRTHLGLWIATGVIADCFFGIRAWRNLQSGFREVVHAR